MLVAVTISFASSAAIQWPESTEPFHINPPGEHSGYLAYGAGSLWMTDAESGKIWRLNPSTGAVQGSLDSTWGGGIAFDGENLWKALYSGPTIRCIRPSDGATVREIPGVGTEQAGLAWDGTHLWIADGSTQRIYRLNPATGAQVSSFDSPGPISRGLVWWNGYLYHVDSHEGTIYQLDPTTGEIVSRIASPGSDPRGLAFDGASLWHSDRYRGIDRMVIEVSADERTVRSNPSLMMTETTYSTTNTGTSTISNPTSYWATPVDDTGHEIIALNYDPPPDDYVYDMFDQRIAHFSFPPLAPGATHQIVRRTYQRVWRVNHQVDPGQVGSLGSVPQEIRDLYLVDADFLQISHPDVVAAALGAVAGETNPHLMAVRIHDYVAQHLVYDTYDEWDAPSILNAGIGGCQQYAIVFMALGRSVGLPTRMVSAVHYLEASDSEGPHSWAEAYVPSYGWIPFDPTRDDRDPLRQRHIGFETPEIVYFRDGGTDDRFVYWWGRCWWTGGLPRSTARTVSGLAPLRVDSFAAETGTTPCSVSLSWSNPLASDLSAVVVKRKTGTYPASRNDGVTVYEDTTPTPEANAAFVDSGLVPGGVYYYAVFTQSATGIWRSIVEQGVNADFAVASSTEDTSAVFRIDSTGSVFGDGMFSAAQFLSGSADIAEWADVSEPVTAGDVLQLDPNAIAAYRPSQTACSSLVAGVVSTESGIVLGQAASCVQRALLALSGIVPVKVTNEGGPIQPGDLLVTSSTPGHAMRWSHPEPCHCALVGKALEPMIDETGMILVLLTAH
jgi:transglutaminase-like putative cysteine protease/streptogramin lyase